jgi:hypothetical protein
MRSLQLTAPRRGLVVLCSILATLAIPTLTTPAGAQQGSPGAVATDDEEFWEEMDIRIIALRLLLVVYEVRSASSTGEIPLDPQDVEQFIADYQAEGIRPNLTASEVTYGLQDIAGTITLLNQSPGVLSSTLEAQFRATLTQIQSKLADL